VESSRKVHAAIRLPVAVGFAFLAAWLVRDLAEPVEFLKSTIGGPFHHIAQDAAEQILFTLALAFPALWVADRLVRSRTLAVLFSLAALVLVLWLTASRW
jgi:hypothetical protein